MTYSIWQTIAETPWWFYVAFIIFLRLSFAATKTRIIHISHLFFLPAIFIPFSLISIYYTVTWQMRGFFLWSAACLFGIFWGWWQFRLRKIKAIKNQAQLCIPGTWNFFFIFIVFFLLKYYYDFSLTFDFNLLKQPQYANVFLALYGFLAGILLGRILYARRCLRIGPFLAH